MRMNQFLSVAVAAFGLAGHAAAQNEPAAPVSESETAQWTPAWGDDEIAKVADLLTGTWQTTETVPETGEDAGGSVKLVMQIAPVPVDGTTMLYSEVARADQTMTPYRQTLYAMYRYKGNIRLRTYEIKWPEQSKGMLVGIWAAPSYFPELTKNDLIATLDVELSAAGSGFSGSTPYPYPTGVGGAVEMTSKVDLSENRLVTADRGFDADGKVVWGAEQGGQWEWTKIANPVKVHNLNQGVIALDYARPEGDTNKPGDKVFVHYSGWTDDGNRFDSSRPRGAPFDPVIPALPTRPLIEGWNIGLLDMTVGTKRRLIIPSEAGYGVRGQPRANIAPNEPLFFEIEVMGIQHTDAAAGSGEVDEHEGHDHP